MSFFSFLQSFSLNKKATIFKFNNITNCNNWIIVNDSVMGGVSSSSITLNEENKGVFSGEVSLENNGGFTLVKTKVNHSFSKSYSKVQLRVKGDGKEYQFRIKSEAKSSYWYIQKFETNASWQNITLNLKNFYPSLRGNKLEQPNFDATKIKAIAFLIGNKKQESFKLLIDEIKLIK